MATQGFTVIYFSFDSLLVSFSVYIRLRLSSEQFITAAYTELRAAAYNRAANEPS